MSLHRTSCKGCACDCRDCSDNGSSLHLHVEIENLKQRLLEKENHIVTMETNFLREAEKFPNGEMAALTDELLTWQDKYSRLYEAHKRVQKVNQNLEDKLLRIVDKCETEKSILTNEVATLTRRLVDEKFNVNKLLEENERYRNDVNLAIQLLQCKPANFVPQKYHSLPIDLQQKVRSYVSSKRRVSVCDSQQKQPEMKTIKVPIPTFPPTAMVYSVNKSNDEKDGSSGGCGEEKSNRHGTMDIVSAAIMAKVLEEREKERSRTKHCDTCSCLTVSNNNEQSNCSNVRHHNKETQTVSNCNSLFFNEPNICNSNSNTGKSNNINGSNSISCINISNHSSHHNIQVDSVGKLLKTGNGHSISNISTSSPMNIRRSKNVPVNINPFASSSSDVTMLEKENVSQTDFFSDFNMISVLDNRDSNLLNFRDEKADKQNLSNNYTRGSNKQPLINDIMSASIGNSNGINLVHDNFSRNNKAVLGNNQKNSCSSSNSNNFYNNIDDESNNLIIFDKQPPALIPKISSNNLTSASPSATTVSTAGNSMLAPTTATLTVLGGNLNISSTSIGNRSGSARHCSVRLQEGTSNILLDNVVDGPYAPVLYKSRQQPTSDPLLVHIPPSRSLSASSSVSSCNDDQRNSTDVINSVNNALQSMSFSSSSSTSSSSSSTSSSSLTNSSHKNLILAQLRTETEI